MELKHADNGLVVGVNLNLRNVRVPSKTLGNGTSLIERSACCTHNDSRNTIQATWLTGVVHCLQTGTPRFPQ